MYASLDRIDVISTGEDGSPWYLQTDHRSADEIAQTRELSTIFAMVRLLNAQCDAASRGEPARISYVLSSPPPAFFSAVIAAWMKPGLTSIAPRRITRADSSVMARKEAPRGVQVRMVRRIAQRGRTSPGTRSIAQSPTVETSAGGRAQP